MLKNLSNTEQTILVIGGIIFLILLIIVIVLLINKLNKSNKKYSINEQTDINENNDKSANIKEIYPAPRGTILDLEVKKEAYDENQNKFNIGEAANKIEETLENNNNIDLTKYEVEQEEKSIISYNELKRIVEEQKNKDVKVVTFDKPKEEIKEPKKEVSFNTEVLDFSDVNSDYKFKPSEFVSPINGIEKKESNQDILDLSNLDDSIKSSSEFLDALKELKSNLNL